MLLFLQFGIFDSIIISVNVFYNIKTGISKFELSLFKLGHSFFSTSMSYEECVFCGHRTFSMPLCGECSQKLFLNFALPDERRCAKCGKLLLSEETLCSSCRGKSVLSYADSVFPLWSYRLWMKSLLFEWKINGCRSLSPLFALALEKALVNIYGKQRLVPLVPVPPRPGKIKKTGWDQIDELCNILHSCYGRSVVHLIKRVSDVQQKKLNRENRLSTSFSSYRPIFKEAFRLKNKGLLPEEVVLIDDVMTTGATIETCSAILKRLGVRKVQVITLLIVD